MSGWRIVGIDPAPFLPLAGLPDDALATRGVIRMRADARPGFPCRVTLEDAEPGETLLLLNHEHQPADTPYRSRHAIFVREGATERAVFAGEVPDVLTCRLLSVRAFDAEGMMVDADVVEGAELAPLIDRFFADRRAAYLHVHNARRGCFAATVERA